MEPAVTARRFRQGISNILLPVFMHPGKFRWSFEIVLKPDQTGSQVLQKAFNLGDGEEKFIVNARIG